MDPATPDPDPRPIVLVGMRASGKTSVGRALAERLGRGWVDLDAELVRWAVRSGDLRDLRDPESAGDVLAALDEPRFRELESEVLRRTLEGSPRLVVSSGGGVVERADNRAWLRRTAWTVWLDVPAHVLQERMRADPALRPALGRGADPVAEVPGVLARRESLYRSVSDFVCVARESESIASVVEGIVTKRNAS